ncbi:kinesin-domain-containing protein [Lichtheimia hyalospora FSU 10163]|nr:kinesin-domain-containing protein [Lichtheimia hyalospora FSU 10163]
MQVPVSFERSTKRERIKQVETEKQQGVWVHCDDCMLVVEISLRIRPLTSQDRAQPRFASLSEDDVLETQDNSVHVIPHNKTFHFDHVFRPSCSQADIFSTVGDALVNKFVDGYNTTILAYGQTSSGKTYTMGTAESQLQQEGIVPRAVSKLFGLLHRDNSIGHSSIKVSFIEIYNEEVIDLLSPYPLSERPPITIREDPKGHIYWTGVREMTVHSACDVLAFLQQGSRNRATGATDMNDKSSRSHAILSLTLQRRSDSGDSKGMTVTSKFHFVDLAGSERLKRTAAQGDRRKEGININSGLLALGNVISVLGNDKQQQHVPYRDSKLTRLLQDSLGGNAATLMIACVSPAEYNLSETANTLQYASRARHIKNKVQQVQEWMTTDNVELLRSMVSSLLKHQQHIEDDHGVTMDTEPSYQQQRLMIVDLHHRLEKQRNALSVTCTRNRVLEQDLHRLKKQKQHTWNDDDFMHLVEPVIEEYEKNIAALESQLAMARAALNHADREIEEQQNKIEKYEIVMDDQERLIQEYECKNNKQQQHNLENELDTLRLKNHNLEMDLVQMSRKYQELQRHQDDNKRASVSSTCSQSSSGSTLVGEGGGSSYLSNEKSYADRKELYEQVRRLQDNLLALKKQADERDHAVESRIQCMNDKLQAVTQEKEQLQAKLYDNRDTHDFLSTPSSRKRPIDLPETTSQYVALHDQYSELTDRMQSAIDKLRAVVQTSRKSAVLMRHMADFERQLEKHKSKVLDEMLKLEVEFDEFFQQRNTEKIVFVLGHAKHGLHDLSLAAIKLEEKVQQAELALTDRAMIPTTATISTTCASLYS